MEDAKKEPTKDKVVSEVDRLKAENLHLRAISITREISILALQLQSKEQEAQQAKKALTEFREELSTKYNIDFDRHQIHPETGQVIPIVGSAIRAL